MIWKKCKLLVRRKIGEDELQNPVYEWVEVKKTLARFTPWTDEQIVLEGREVAKNEQRYIIPIPFKDFPDCQMVEMDGQRLDITEKADLSPRWTLIQVKAYKGVIWSGNCQH